MRRCNTRLHSLEERIERVEAHRVNQVFDSLVGFTYVNFRPSAQQPSRGHVWIERQSSIERGCTFFDRPSTWTNAQPPE